VRLRTRPQPEHLLSRSPAARFVAGPEVDDALRVAAELVAAGLRVSVEHVPADPAADVTELSALVELFGQAGPVDGCDLRLDVDRLGAGPATWPSYAASTSCWPAPGTPASPPPTAA
jgi:proline dehydrogenase